MIQHLVLFKFLESAQGKTKQENLELAKEKALAMKDAIPEIQSLDIYFGADGSPESNHDFILVSTFHSMEELETYQKHPVHVAFGEFIGGLRAPDSRTCIDYEI